MTSFEQFAKTITLPSDDLEVNGKTWKILVLAWNAALSQAVQVVKDERLLEPETDEDLAYDTALIHAVNAIKKEMC